MVASASSSNTQWPSGLLERREGAARPGDDGGKLERIGPPGAT